LQFWAVTLIALVVALRVMARQPRRVAVWTGFMLGAGYGVTAMCWIVEPFFVEPEIYGWLSPLAIIGIGAGMGAFWAFGVGVGHMLGGARPFNRAAGMALGLLAAEFGRSYLFTGLPWALIGHSFVGTPVAQLAAVIGPLGLSAAMLCLCVLGAVPSGRSRSVAALIGAAVFAGAWAWGAGRLAAPVEAGVEPPATVRLVQPNAPQALKWRDGFARMFFDRHLSLSAAPFDGARGARELTPPMTDMPILAQGKRPDLVIWPETAVPFWLDETGTGLDLIAQATGTMTALGIQRAQGVTFFNSMAVVTAQGQLVDVYDKFHLVPFGEYVPYGDALARFGITAFAAQQGNGYSAGEGAKVLDLGAAGARALGKVQPLICYEAVFPQDLRAAPERPDWLMQITNDAWFGQLVGPQQHLAQARLRAIEQGLPMLRVANTGISAVIDAKGEVLAQLGMDRAGLIDADLPAALPPTPYAKRGDLPVFLALLLGVAVVFLRRRRV
jgi:apolipoprotein N-acyltransferase